MLFIVCRTFACVNRDASIVIPLDSSSLLFIHPISHFDKHRSRYLVKSSLSGEFDSNNLVIVSVTELVFIAILWFHSSILLFSPNPLCLRHFIQLRHIPIHHPTPNIQPNLLSLLHRQPRMPTLRVPLAIDPHILPIHGITRDGFKNNPLVEIFLWAILLTIHHPRLIVILAIICCGSSSSQAPIYNLDIALDKFTPGGISRLFQTREVCAAAFTLAVDVHHEAADAAAVLASGAPVVVVGVVAAFAVALGPELLDKGVSAPALEGACAVFDTFYGLGAWQGGFF